MDDPTQIPPNSANTETRIVSRGEAGFLNEVNDRLVQLMNPLTEARVPAVLSGNREVGLEEFLENAVNKLCEQETLTHLIVLSPDLENIEGLKEALAECLVALCPALAERNLAEIAPRDWVTQLRAEENRKDHPKMSRVVIVDNFENLFDEKVSDQTRSDFMRVVTDLAQLFDTTVLLVSDHAVVEKCRTTRGLETSIGSRFHVRVPVTGQPPANAQHAKTDQLRPWTPPIKTERIRPKQPNREPVKVGSAHPDAKPEEKSLKVASTPSKAPERVASGERNPRDFWKQVTWVWLAGYGVAMVLIVGMIVLGSSLPSISEYDSYANLDPNEAVPAPPAEVLTPVTAMSAEEFNQDGSVNLVGFIHRMEQTQAPTVDILVTSTMAKLRRQNPKRSLAPVENWFKRANASPNALETEVGQLYQSDLVTDSPAKALSWYRKGEKAGCNEASYRMAETLLLNPSSGGLRSEAIKFLRSNENGDGRKTYLFAVCLLNGIGIENDYFGARKLLERAVDQGSTEAFAELGLMHEQGLGGMIDQTKAGRIFRDGAESGNVFCMDRYAKRLAQGRGVARDPKLSQIWQSRAANTTANKLHTAVQELNPRLYR